MIYWSWTLRRRLYLPGKMGNIRTSGLLKERVLLPLFCYCAERSDKAISSETFLSKMPGHNGQALYFQ